MLREVWLWVKGYRRTDCHAHEIRVPYLSRPVRSYQNDSALFYLYFVQYPEKKGKGWKGIEKRCVPCNKVGVSEGLMAKAHPHDKM